MSGSAPLVLLPDILCDIALFDPVLRHLSADRPVMFVPLLGGDSSAALATAILAVLPPRFAVLGQGLGGVIAMEIASRAPERIERLALIGSYPQTEMPAKAAEREPRVAIARGGRMEAVAEAEFPAETLAPGAGRAAVMRAVAAMARRTGPQIYADHTRALQRRPDHQGTLRRLHCPALVLCGAHDMLAPPRRQQIVAELIRGAVYCMLDDAGHMPTLEAPEAVMTALQGWLRT